MAQPAADSRATDDAEEDRCCPVCLEPPEWVAAGRCGHREVCVSCAIRMRFFQNDRRCCLCREFCPTVLVTKSGKQEANFSKSKTPPSPPSSCATGRRAVGNKYFWYLGGMAAYFDDPEQYDAARKKLYVEGFKYS
jgi:hypothetical protein